jgi:pSer/pThr/pTyr-binding forkhead associated (FHA) protein
MNDVSQLSLTLLRLGFLTLLWGLVLTAIAVLRADIYGTRVFTRGRGRTNTRAMRTPRAAPSRASTGVRNVPRTLSEGRPRLAVIAGPLKGTSIPLGETAVTIGRSPRATLVIEDDYCSSRHARIFLEGDAWLVEDLGSTNGTFLDDAKLTEPQAFLPGSRLTMGATSLEMRA